MTERGSIDELSRVLGGIEAGLATVNRTLAENRIADATYRTDIRKEITAIRDNVQDVSADLQTCKSDITDMKPKLLALETKDLKEQGAWGLGRAIIYVLYLMAAILAGFAGGYFGHHPIAK